MNRWMFINLTMLIMLLLPLGPLHAQQTLIDADESIPPDEQVSGPIEEYTAGWTKTEGLFTYYTDEATRRVLIEINADEFDTPYFVNITLNRGTGDQNFTAPMMWGQSAIEFHRNAMYVEFVEPNYSISTVMGEPMARAVESGISDTIIGKAQIEAEDENSGRLVIDLASFLLSATGIDVASWTWGGGISVDLEGAYIDSLTGFPMNDEIETRIPVYGAGDAFGRASMGSQVIGLHYSVAAPPDEGYVPRLADDRIGHFLDMTVNYSVETDTADTRYIRYANRFRLEKADPDAEMSAPVEPIVFWLENTIPYEYRDAVREGVLLWNDAFERIGFRNAIVVRQMRDDAEWDPADIRYNTIRWFVSPTSTYAIGPSRSDPRTGQIYDADVGVNADMMRSVYFEYEFSVEPIRQAIEMIAPPGWPNLDSRQVRWDEETVRTLESRITQNDVRLGTDNFAVMHALEGARAATILRSRGQLQPGSLEEQEFYHDYLVSLVCHEVGHVLGLRHNFAASSATPYWKLHHEYWTQEHGLTSSVMDYATANIAPEGELQGEYFQTSLGDYDYWAIEYAYSEFNAETLEEEALEEIASRSPQYRYATDEDYYGWSRNMDPDIFVWDLGDDPVRWHRDRITASNQLLDGILEHWSDPGTRPADIRRAFIYAVWDYTLASFAVPRLIGGVRMYRDHIDDPDAHPAMVPVSAEEQRFALGFLRDSLWAPGIFDFDPELLNMLGRDRSPTFDWTILYTGSFDFDIHEYVLSVQTEPFYWIYDPLVLERVINNEIRMPDGAEVFTLIELFDTVRDSIWTELATGDPIDSYRRNLQRAHLDMITGLVLNPAYMTPEDAVTLARRDLITLKNQITALMTGDAAIGMDAMTAAHLDECLSRISLTLTAPMDRGGDMSGLLLMY